MPSMEVFQYPYLSDNYGVLIHCPDTGETASVDVGDSASLQSALTAQRWELSHILITHHHADHTAGLADAKKIHQCTVIGPGSHSKIAGLDKQVNDGDTFLFGGVKVEVIHTPGHTLDMINFYLPTEKMVFTGDTLFALGCGRLFEGDAAMMWSSLEKLKKLPSDTTVYCSHEYTQANANFAVTVDPHNEQLKLRKTAIEQARADNQATVPSLLSEELATNPFLRATDPGIRKHLAMENASDVEVFTEIRSRKDNF